MRTRLVICARSRTTAVALLGAAVVALASTPVLARPTPGPVPPPAPASPTPTPKPLPASLMPASSFTYAKYLDGTDYRHGVINVIVYGPGLNDSLDIPDRMGWQTLPHTTQYANITPGCGDAKSYEDQGWSPDPKEVVHNQVLFWLSPGSKGLGSDCRASSRFRSVQVPYGSAAVLYSYGGSLEPPQLSLSPYNGGELLAGYSCGIGADCVVPNVADKLGESGFEFGRDGLPSSVGIREGDTQGGGPVDQSRAVAVQGLADAIDRYITSQGWSVTTTSYTVNSVRGFTYTNADEFTNPNLLSWYAGSSDSTATFKDGKVTVICAAPPTDPGFCSSNGGGGCGPVTVR